jgi:simple sugar transport system permease protein
MNAVSRSIHFIKGLGLARGIILVFTFTLFGLALAMEMQVAQLTTDSLLRIGRNGVLVLALLPCIKGGLGLNFGLPLGILAGLLGLVTSVEFELTGMTGFGAALGLAIGLGAVVGFFYGKLLNKVKGDEMVVGTYAGFASVSLMCLFWLMGPFRNPNMIWAIGGKGLRTTIPLDGYYAQILDTFLAFKIGSITIPTGLLVFFALACFLVWLFFHSKIGIGVAAAGQNEKFARASSILPNQSRLLATILSTILAAVGIVVYCQSFGFIQLYTAPLLMAFPIVACILIGGAGVAHATIFNVVFGSVVFQTLLTITLPVTSSFIKGDISETARIIISNGIILYALTSMSGAKK